MPQNPGQVLVGLNGTTPIAIPTAADRSLSVSQTLPDYYREALGGTIFSAANPSGVTTSVGLATTYVGICLSNPAGNTNNLIVLTVTGSLIVAPSIITTLGLIVGYAAGGVTVHTTALTTRAGLVGTGPAATGLVDSACTLVGTPAWERFIAQCGTATTAAFASLDLKGGIVIPPGGYLAVGTTIAGPSSGFQGSIQWAERPIAG